MPICPDEITACVSVLRLSFDDDALYDRLYAEVSDVRRQKADRLARREDAIRCLGGEVLLRQTLHRLGLDAMLAPEIGEHGKPYLPIDGFHYNISHGGQYVVLAYAKSEVGVDVEPIAQSERRIALAKRFFTPYEQQLIHANDGSMDIATRFTVAWTRKESYVKYTGIGLSQGLQSFSVDLRLPRGGIIDATGKSLPLTTHTILTEDGHAISLCSSLAHIETEYVRL
jgi:4'-phosphopantetheinyl transferase